VVLLGSLDDVKNDTNIKRFEIGKIRRSQLITTFGPGAIVDLLNYSVVIGAIDLWSDKGIEIDEPNLRRLLNVKQFKEPPILGSEENTHDDIPAFRFPEMYFCPQCGRLMSHRDFGIGDKFECKKCHVSIVPSRFIAACINGHLEDFPYDWWVHGGHFTECRKKEKHNLRIEFLDTSGGLESIVIKCEVCGAHRDMKNCMNKEALLGYPCQGKRPWVGHGEKYNDPQKCEAKMRTLQRGASNVYFPVTESALTIPPWSSKVQQIVAECWSRIVKNLREDSELKLSSACRYEYNGLNCKKLVSFEDFLEAAQKRLKNEKDKTKFSRQDLIEEEYKTFCHNNQDDGDLKTEHTSVPSFLKDIFDDIVLVRRLREVLVLRGFRRITPDKSEPDNVDFKGLNVEMTSLSSKEVDWLPAIAMLGEGIFIRLNEEKLQDWEGSQKNLYKIMAQRLLKSTVRCDNFSARYVLLHTLSHLLMRQLSIECGYSGAAIKERIYSTYPGSQKKMAGILLYTSTSDSDGSLGGLVRNGLSDSFERIFRSMLQEASWCSSDPICIQSMAQGYDSLNYAACHACTLMPETSCQMRNCLLDRASIVGSLDDKGRGFFSSLLGK